MVDLLSGSIPLKHITVPNSIKRVRYLYNFSSPFAPLHQYSYSPHCSCYNSYDTDKENLFDSQGFLKLVASILVTLTFDSRVTLKGLVRN